MEFSRRASRIPGPEVAGELTPDELAELRQWLDTTPPCQPDPDGSPVQPISGNRVGCVESRHRHPRPRIGSGKYWKIPSEFGHELDAK